MAFSMNNAITRILRAVADPDGYTYCDAAYQSAPTNMDGLAKDIFWESVLAIMQIMYSKPIKAGEQTDEVINIQSLFTNDDVIGLITTAETSILASGKISLTGLTQYYKLIDIYPNPEGTTPLPLCVKKIDVDYFKGVMIADFVDDNTIFWYDTGSSVTFYPKEQVTTIENYKVDVVYVKQPLLSAWDGTSGDAKDLCELFSLPFIFKAINMASAKINKEKEVV